MFTYTTCRDCGGLLHTTTYQQTVHPDCVDQPTKVELLVADWLSAATAGDNEYAEQLQQQIGELEKRPPRLLDAALTYASWGWPVFPLKPCSKQPATRHGFKDAHTHTDRIKTWWTTHPDHNIGLPTGIKFDVIDIDGPTGHATLTRLADEEDQQTSIGDIGDTHGRVMTASGGYHLYITPSGDGNSAGIAAGIDYRGRGGYVVAPPSALGGHRWSWTQHPSPVITGRGDTYGK